MITEIPMIEYESRIKKIQATLVKRGIDILIVFGTDCEPQNLIYLSNYWPQFETGSVVIPQEGEACLVIGPESETFAREFSVIDKIFKVMEHRESSEPNYPNEKLDTYGEIFNYVLNGKKAKKSSSSKDNVGSIPYKSTPAGFSPPEINRTRSRLFSSSDLKQNCSKS